MGGLPLAERNISYSSFFILPLQVASSYKCHFCKAVYFALEHVISHCISVIPDRFSGIRILGFLQCFWSAPSPFSFCSLPFLPYLPCSMFLPFSQFLPIHWCFVWVYVSAWCMVQWTKNMQRQKYCISRSRRLGLNYSVCSKRFFPHLSWPVWASKSGAASLMPYCQDSHNKLLPFSLSICNTGISQALV